jgi:hypothetical protein
MNETGKESLTMSLAPWSDAENRLIEARVKQLRDWFDGPPCAPIPTPPWDDDPEESAYEMPAIEPEPVFEPSEADWRDYESWSEELDRRREFIEAMERADVAYVCECERHLDELARGIWD